MSMMFMRMPGQTWPGAAAMFLAMWIGMMVPMMTPSLVVMLRRSADVDRKRVAAAYFLVWMLLGAAIYPIGVVLMMASMRSPRLGHAVPFVIVLAGVLQLTRWKSRQLAKCCAPRVRSGPWTHGLSLGWHCILCCSGLMAILLVLGMMNIALMVLITAAITIERYAPRPLTAARVIGLIAIVAGIGRLLL
jgi:predicted metal-binding membrane protein